MYGEKAAVKDKIGTHSELLFRKYTYGVMKPIASPKKLILLTYEDLEKTTNNLYEIKSKNEQTPTR